MRNLTFPKGILHLLYWIYFKPLTLRRHVRQLDPRLDERLELWQVQEEMSAIPHVRSLAWLWWTLLAIAPLGATIVVGLAIELISSFDWARGLFTAVVYTMGLLLGNWLRWRVANERIVLVVGSVSGLVFGLVFGVAVGFQFDRNVGFVFGMAFGLAGGLAVNPAGGLAVVLASVLAVGLAFGLPFGLAIALAFGLAVTLAFGRASGPIFGLIVTLAFIGAFGWAFGPASGLIGGFVVGVSFLIGYFRLVVYVFELPYGLFMSRLAEITPERARRLLQKSPVYFDEIVSLPLLGLDRHLVAVGRQDRQIGAEEIAHVAQSFRQGWAARNALVELMALEMEDAKDVESVARMADRLVWLPPELPTELEKVLPAVHQVSQRIKAVQESETLWNKRENLVRAQREVQSIRQGWSLSPQGKVAARFGPILEDWQKLLGQQEAALAEQQAREGLVPNVYIVGSPLITDSEVFKGRRDLFLALERALTGAAEQRPTLLLYGQRRSGKTSVLHQLPLRLGPDCIPVFVDMQSAANAESATGLLYSLSRAIIGAARDLRRLRLPSLSREELSVDPYIAFQEWLTQVQGLLDQRIVLLNLDEYERLEEMLQDKRVDRRMLNLLRNLTQHNPHLVVLLSGSHVPQDMPPYWADYLIGVQLLRVGYLRDAEARELIEKPIPDFPLRYEESAVKRILQATRGQPFLVQATCQQLVDRMNRERRRHATLADAEATLQAIVAADDTLYWRELWAGRDSDDAQRRVLLVLARQPDGVMDEATLAGQVGRETLEKALPRLLHRDILEKTDSGYRFQVELMLRWVQRHGSLASAS